MITGYLKSPVNRMGGKYYLTGWLCQHIPGHRLYCEPFCGAGHLLFDKRPSPVEVLNDVDGHLIGFFQVIKDPEKRRKASKRFDVCLYAKAIVARYPFPMEDRGYPTG